MSAGGTLYFLSKYFQSTLPYGMRHKKRSPTVITVRFQSTHPLRDATWHMCNNNWIFLYFNPRTPYGMRPKKTHNPRWSGYFNPRTPYGMRRNWVGGSCDSWWHFNPRTPYGMRLCSCQPQILHILFQSTHPLRDATKVNRLQLSISLFQSTHPLRDATLHRHGCNRPADISIHAPLTGCDVR